MNVVGECSKRRSSGRGEKLDHERYFVSCQEVKLDLGMGAMELL